MSDLGIVAAGVLAAASQPVSDASALNSPELRAQEDQWIAGMLASPQQSASARQARPLQDPTKGQRPIATPPQFSPAAQPSSEALRRARLEARLRQLERSALSQAPGAVVSFQQPQQASPEFTPASPALGQPVVPQPTLRQQSIPRPLVPIRPRPQPLSPRNQIALTPPSTAFATLNPPSRVGVSRSVFSGTGGDRLWNTRTRYSYR